MLMYHGNLFIFLLPNEGWRCINWSFWGHWLTEQGMWHMFYIALSSSSVGTHLFCSGSFPLLASKSSYSPLSGDAGHWCKSGATLLDSVKLFLRMWKLCKQEWHQVSWLKYKPLVADPPFLSPPFFSWDYLPSWKKAHKLFRHVFL